MIGRDYSLVGSEEGIRLKIDETMGKGPVRMKFINRNTLGIFDTKRTVHIYSMTRGLITRVESDPFDNILDEVDDGSDHEKDEALMDRNVNMDINDFCVTNKQQEVVLCGCRHQMEIMSTREWLLEKSLTRKGGPRELAQSTFYPTYIESFAIGPDNFFCVLQQKVNRMQIMSDDGTVIASLGSTGIAAGEFRQPTSCSCYIDESMSSRGNVNEIIVPKWYRVDKSPEELMKEINCEPIGTFYLTKAQRTSNFFQLVFVDSRCKVGNLSICQESANVFTTMYDSDEYTSTTLISLIKILQGRFLQYTSDPRPYAIIAVADSLNARVQLMKYYWTETDIFVPELIFMQSIGGTKHLFATLHTPTDVSFSPDGELAVVDSGAGHNCVYIFSKTLRVIKKVFLGFMKYEVKEKKKEVQPTGADSEHENMMIQHHKETKNEKYMSAAIEKDKRRNRLDHTIVSVAFSTDGKLALGYKGGGINILNSYKSYNMGILEGIQTEDFVNVLYYLEYSDFENLRNCCWFLHNFTKRYRVKWEVKPMRSYLAPFVKYSFVKYAKFLNGIGMTMGHRLPDLVEDYEEPSSAVLGPFADESGLLVCMPFLEGKCSAATCPSNLSHQPMYLSGYDLNKQGICIEEKNVMLIISKLFSSEFQWKNEMYIDGIFKALAEEVELLTRSDPMSRKMEVIRNTSTEFVKVIRYKEYLELMTVCEEAFSGVKSFKKHPCFLGRSVRRFNEPAEPFDLINLGCVVTNEAPNKYGADSTLDAQYSNRGIDVPYKISKQKRLKPVYTKGEIERGVGYRAKETHIELFEHRSQEATGLIQKLFS